MTETLRRPQRSAIPSTIPSTIIEPLFERPPSARDAQFQRRRLGLLVGLFMAVLALAPVLASVASPDHDGRGTVVAADSGDPATLAGAIGETTSTLYQTSTTTVPPTTAPPTTAAPTTTVPPTTAPPTTAAPTTTVAPTTVPPTTAAPTTTAPPTTAKATYDYSDPRSTQVWYDLADCEAGGNWAIDSGNGYYGGLQFSLGSWESVGGTGYPHEHPASTQIKMGRRLQARQGWDAWPYCSSQLGLR